MFGDSPKRESPSFSEQLKWQKEQQERLAKSVKDTPSIKLPPGIIPEDAIPLFPYPGEMEHITADKAQARIEFTQADAALKKARLLNFNNKVLVLDEARLLNSRTLAVDSDYFQQEDEEEKEDESDKLIKLALQKVDSVISKENRILYAHVVKMIILGSPTVSCSENYSKYRPEYLKEIELVKSFAPNRFNYEQYSKEPAIVRIKQQIEEQESKIKDSTK